VEVVTNEVLERSSEFGGEGVIRVDLTDGFQISNDDTVDTVLFGLLDINVELEDLNNISVGVDTDGPFDLLDVFTLGSE